MSDADTEINFKHLENQRRFDQIERRISKLEDDTVDIKLILAEQKGQWKAIKYLLGIGVLLLTSNFVITLLSRLG